VASADGSTLASLKAGTSTSVAIIDAASGTVRTRYRVDSSLGRANLSADGSRLAVADGSPAWRWQLSDTRNGRPLGTLEVPSTDAETWNGDLTSGFRFLTPGSGQDAPGPVNPIVAKDEPAHGGEVARLKLDDAYAGTWKSDRPPVDSYPVVNSWQPGVALSPDGGTMAVIYADGDRLALVHLSDMRIRSALAVQRQQSWIDRIGLHVGDVEAKGMDGWFWNATFTYDGRLLTWGQDVHETDQGQLAWTGHGLRLVDPSTGTILQEGLQGQGVDQVVPAPDGSAIFATANGQLGPRTLYRLNPQTLTIEASRQFPGNPYPQLLILATHR
jgi:DNA-binding beta-propeller fold protein YncE